MWVWRALRDAVIAAVVTAARAWIALLFRPWESARLIAALPLNLWRTRAVVDDLFGAGLTVLTPPGEAPQLRTVIIGLGDLTTRVTSSPAPTEALVADHFKAVRERIELLSTTPEALLRLTALTMPALTAYANRNTTWRTENFPDIAFHLFASTFIISFTWAFGMRLASLLIKRRIQHWLEAEPRT